MLVVGGPDPASGLGGGHGLELCQSPLRKHPRKEGTPTLAWVMRCWGKTGPSWDTTGHPLPTHPPPPAPRPQGSAPPAGTALPRTHEALAQRDKTVRCPAWGPGLAGTVYWQPPVQRTWVLASEEAAMQTQRGPAWRLPLRLPLRWAAGTSEPGLVCQGPSSSARMPWGAAGPRPPCLARDERAASAAGPSAERARALLACRSGCRRASP